MNTPLIGVSKNIKKIREVIQRVSGTGLNILIYGETGVGKEVVARQLYRKSSKCYKSYIKVNCAAVPEGLLESELYGYEKGAFTGAEQKKRGKFELADGGVLFLDEIGEMPLHLQAKLLHVLQHGEFTPLGSEKEVVTDAWLIAATNRDLTQAVANKTFREDLYHRLNTLKIDLDPLRKRPEDIPVLIEYYIEQYRQRYGNCRTISKPSSSIMKKLLAYPWPGNVRELQNILKRILLAGKWEEPIEQLTNGSNLTDEIATLNFVLQERLTLSEILSSETDCYHYPDAFSLKHIKKKAIDDIEKKAIVYILDQTNGNRMRAAKILNISYKTLLTKMHELSIFA